MLKQFEKHVNLNLSFLKDARLLLAVSGGLDSVVLTHLCKTIGLNFALAHCNFNLRGDESDADEDFVLDLAEDYNLEVFIEGFDTGTYAKVNKLSTQMAARELRYAWFEDLCTQLDFDFVLTAHHADDDLETFLINLSRGTGLEGLIGIPEINLHSIRPLLPFSRDDIEQYAITQKLTWRDDSSNVSTKYLRNQFRHEVIPILKTINPQFLDNFKNTQTYLREVKDILEDRMDDVLEEVVSKITPDGIYFNINAIKQLSNPKAYLYQLLKDYGFTEWQDVFNLLSGQPGKTIITKSHRLIKDRQTLILTDNQTEVDCSLLVKNKTKVLEVPFGQLTFENVDQIIEIKPFTIYLDKDLLNFPMSIRKWQEGDYFYPLGMKGKKKLSKFFKDEKLSLLDKENTWLLCSKDDIVWVIGKRQDNRFKITNNTKHILKISLH